VVAGIGNALLTQPLVRRLAASFPTVVVSHSRAILDCFAGCGLAGIGQIDLKPARLHQTASTMRGFRAHTVVLPCPANRFQYPLLARLAFPSRIVTHRYPVGRFTALGLLRGEKIDAVPGLHDVEQNNNLLTAFDLEPDDEPPKFEVTPEDEAAADKLLGDARGFTVVHAGSGATVLASAKRWPPAKFAQLVLALEHRGHDVRLWEGPDERGVAEEINRLLPTPRPVLKLTGPLGHAAAVLQRAALYVGTDSGPGHLAAAVGTPPVTIFGIADPVRVCPTGHRHLVVTPPPGTPNFPNAPYPMAATRPRKRYPQPRPIDAIEVDHVLEKVAAETGS
jgi:ADP-heptose:LPS heptosyltransferase